MTPQASAEVAENIIERFGGIDDGPVVEWLRSQGFKYDRTYEWSKPVVTYASISHNEFMAIFFLKQEWDWGGLKEDAEGPK